MLTTLAALAAIETEHDARLEAMLDGVALSDFRRVTGLDPDSHEFVIPAARLGGGQDLYIGNHGTTPIRAYVNASGKLGLREALAHSLNNWFIQLADNMDGKTLPDGARTHLVKTARRFGFTDYYPLAPESLELSRYAAKGDTRTTSPR
ncbi:MAG: hypothetical protein ACRERS_08785 [Methylococcales bacterium]